MRRHDLGVVFDAAELIGRRGEAALERPAAAADHAGVAPDDDRAPGQFALVQTGVLI